MPKVIEFFLYCYALIFARSVFHKWNLFLLHAGFRGLGVLNYQNDKISGERYLLRCFLPKLIDRDRPIIFDVGANEGDYSAAILEVFPKAMLYAFEPHPATFARASCKLGNRAQLNDFALGSAVGQVTLYDRDDVDGSEHATIYPEVIATLHKRPAVAIDVKMSTIDVFAAAHKIDRIDFLKIDTEGHELEVLRGALGLLKAGKLRYVQFEFNEMNAASRVFLRDFRALFTEHRLFRILPNAIVPIDFAPLTAEVFAFQNLLAVPIDEEGR